MYGYLRSAASLLPKDNTYYNIVDLIKHIILLYFYSLFESNILSDEDQQKFLKLLKDNNKSMANYNYEWKLILDSTKDEICKQTFVDKVHGNQNVLILIQVKTKIIVGGYTKTGWDKAINKYEWRRDNDAFVFHLKSPAKHDPFISNVKNEQHQQKFVMGNDNTYYGGMGSTWIWYFDDKLQELLFQANGAWNTFEQFPDGQGYGNLLTGDCSSDCISYKDIVVEVFHINDIA